MSIRLFLSLAFRWCLKKCASAIAIIVLKEVHQKHHGGCRNRKPFHHVAVGLLAIEISNLLGSHQPASDQNLKNSLDGVYAGDIAFGKSLVGHQICFRCLGLTSHSPHTAIREPAPRKGAGSNTRYLFLDERQRLKRRAFCFNVLGFTNPPIGKALAFRSLEDGCRALGIVDFQRLPMVPTEAELVHVALKMGL